MLTRRNALKITLGSFVAALPIGSRAVAAIPADVTAPAVELLPDGLDPTLPRRIDAMVCMFTTEPTGERFARASLVLSNEDGGPFCTLTDMQGTAIETSLTTAEVMRFFASLARH